MGKKKAEPERNILWYLENGWPEQPEGEVSYHTGLRIKPALSNIPLFGTVLAWAINKDGMIPMRGGIREALTALDEIAENWPLIDTFSLRLDQSDDYYKVIFQQLGLDYNERNIRLRVVVARAMAATWRYSHHYHKWKHTYALAREIKDGCKSFAAQYGDKIESMNEQLKRMFLAGKMKSAGDFLHDDMCGYINMLDQYTSAPKHPFEALTPQLFLLARLGEIYACFSGKLPATHASGIPNKYDRLPEGDYLEFLEPALKLLGVASLKTHHNLSLVAKHISGKRGYRNNVLAGGSCGLITYDDFASTRLLNNFSCKSRNYI